MWPKLLLSTGGAGKLYVPGNFGLSEDMESFSSIIPDHNYVKNRPRLFTPQTLPTKHNTYTAPTVPPSEERIRRRSRNIQVDHLLEASVPRVLSRWFILRSLGVPCFCDDWCHSVSIETRGFGVYKFHVCLQVSSVPSGWLVHMCSLRLMLNAQARRWFVSAVWALALDNMPHCPRGRVGSYNWLS